MPRKLFVISNVLFLLIALTGAEAAVKTQCPPGKTCRHLVGVDGFATMADGYPQYIFSFVDVTGVPDNDVLAEAELNAQHPAPTIRVKQGDEFYLTLTTAPMKMRPDLFDAHSIHWHGFPNATPVFDGEPMASIGTNPGASFTFYYKVPPSPGTYAYHCHVEASEHMQMGMLGHLSVTPIQDDGPPIEYPPLSGKFYSRFAYNDGDGSTGYDRDYPVMIIGYDPLFHDNNLAIQPLPFADMHDRYMTINGRGYPDTINPGVLPPPTLPDGGVGKVSQSQNALMEAYQGERILLRVASLSTVHFSTLTIPGITMKVVGRDAQLLRGPTGANLYYDTNTITLGGGETFDVILETENVPAGTYFLYTTNHRDLSNNKQDYGGLMTEIVIHPPLP